jgi:hypothetical protein
MKPRVQWRKQVELKGWQSDKLAADHAACL